jgi:hypothetical protein
MTFLLLFEHFLQYENYDVKLILLKIFLFLIAFFYNIIVSYLNKKKNNYKNLIIFNEQNE